MHPRPSSLPLLLLLFLLSSAPAAHAAWPNNPAVNVPVCTASVSQSNAASLPDGAGGAFVAWWDYRTGACDLYMQHVGASGVAQWTANGVVLCNATGSQSNVALVSDGAGGFIATWHDSRSTSADIYAQRVNASGAVQWTANGVVVCNQASDQYYPTIVSDGQGGAVIAWQDYRNGSWDIYVQRVNASGTAQWTANGVVLCTATTDQTAPVATTDGAGGAIAVWQDNRNGNTDIYAQHVTSAGSTTWAGNGAAICTSAYTQQKPAIVADGLGGALISWQDWRSAMNYDLWAQRVLAGGSMAWAANGVSFCTATNDQYAPCMIPDGSNGFIVAWYDWRGGNADVYVQRMSGAGAVQWTADGVLLCNLVGDQTNAVIAADGAGGALVAWQDPRGGSNSDIYAQRVSSSGAIQWTANGVAVSTALADQTYPSIVSDGAGGAIVHWTDARLITTTTDIFAQHVDAWGYLGAAPVMAGVKDVPNDQGGVVKVSWYASALDSFPAYAIDSYLVFRSVPSALAVQALQQGAVLATPADADRYPERRALLAGAGGVSVTAWEYLGSTTSYHLPICSYVAPTLCDSIEGSNPRTLFLVEARNAAGTQWWFSDPDSGYSVDNLSPLAPAAFTGEYLSGTSTLHWLVSAEADFAQYRLYSGHSSDFEPAPENLVAALADTGYADAAGSPCFYKLCAVDVHGNVSPYATLLPSGTAGVPGRPTPLALALAGPAPNPLRTATTLRLALPRAARVSLTVFDQQGRRVRTLLTGEQPAGEHDVTWDGRDQAGRPVASGIYFARLEAEGRALTRRIVALR